MLEPLAITPDASVLILGQGSISLYTVLCTKHLGATRVAYASSDQRSLEDAASLGTEVMLIEKWPRKLGSFNVTVDRANEASGL